MLVGLLTFCNFLFFSHCFGASSFVFSFQSFPGLFSFQRFLVVDETKIVISSDSSDVPSSSSYSNRKRDLYNRGSASGKGVVFFTFFVLGFVLLLAYFFLKFVQKMRFLGTAATRGDQKKLIKVVASCPLKGHAEICVVEIAYNFYIIGVSSGGVYLFEKITEKDIIDRLDLELVDREVHTKNFLHLLMSKVGGLKNKVSVENMKFDTETRINRLKDLSSSHMNSSGQFENENKK